MHDYKIKSGRMFPTWCEVLEVLQSLGYRKQTTELCALQVRNDHDAVTRGLRCVTAGTGPVSTQP